MRKFTFLKNVFSVFLVSALAACGQVGNSNLSDAADVDSADELELITSGEDYVTYLADNDEELAALGLAGKKERKRKQSEASKVKPPPKKKEIKTSRASATGKKVVPQKAPQAARKKSEAVKPKGRLASKAKKAIEKQQRVSQKSLKRQGNLLAAMDKLQTVKAMPSKGLMQAKAKCEAISDGVKFLKNTQAPKRPFDGLRKNFRSVLRKQRDEVLKVNGFTSCGAVKQAVASLPPAEPIAQVPADEVAPAEDVVDEIVVDAEEELAEEEIDTETIVVDDNGNVLSAEVINYI